MTNKEQNKYSSKTFCLSLYQQVQCISAWVTSTIILPCKPQKYCGFYMHRLLILFCISALSALIYIRATQLTIEYNRQLFDLIFNAAQNLQGLAAIITSLGDSLFVIIAGLLTTALLIKWQQYRISILLIGTLFISKAVNSLLKVIIAYPRPDSGSHLSTFSFPSGHTLSGTVLLLSIAVLLAANSKRWLQWSIYGIALTIGAMIGWSRIALGLHWPLDVIAAMIEAVLAASIFYWLHGSVSLTQAQKSQLIIWLAFLWLVYSGASVLFF